MRKEFLSFSPPLIGEEEIQEVVDTLRSDWITTGPKTKRFEEAFARFVGAPGALGLNSCTAGLHTALVTAGIGQGDEVATTTLTFAATVNVIEQVGARPVLVDVEPDTLNMDPRKVEACLSGKTKAIIPVHYAGHPVEMDGILEIARSRRLLVVEDAAHALPARYRGRFVGSGSNPASFSFYATKNLTTGEGGMLTADPSFLERARIVSLHGMSRDAWKRYDKAGGWFYEVVLPGFKYNMTDIQASLGLHQLKKLEAFQKRRRRLVEMYQEAFRGEEALEIPVEKAHVEHAWYLYVLRIVPETLTIHRDRFIEELKERKIGTSVHFIPIHFHPYYRDKYGYGKRDFPVARGNYERMMSLPLNLRMTDGDVADVVEAVLEVVRKFRR